MANDEKGSSGMYFCWVGCSRTRLSFEHLCVDRLDRYILHKFGDRLLESSIGLVCNALSRPFLLRGREESVSCSISAPCPGLHLADWGNPCAGWCRWSIGLQSHGRRERVSFEAVGCHLLIQRAVVALG